MVTTKAAMRKYVRPEKNRLHGDDFSMISGNTGVVDYWMRVARQYPIKPWLDYEVVWATIISEINPAMQVSNGKTYKKVKDSLNKIADILQDEKYGVGAIRRVSWDMLPSDVTLEAIRIYGDAKEGFGTFPQEILGGFYAAGLVWLTVNPSH